MRSQLSYYPVFLNVRGRRCVIFGGGDVALRKAQTLLECGAVVQVISPLLCDGMVRLARDGKIAALVRDYRPGDLVGAFLAIAATGDREANRRVAAEADEHHIPVNVVDDPALCSFIVPAIVRRGELTVAVSTGGSSPALARRIRAKLEQDFGHEYEDLARVVGAVRRELRSRDIRCTADRWQNALDVEVLVAMIKQGRVDDAKGLILKRLNVTAEVGGTRAP